MKLINKIFLVLFITIFCGEIEAKERILCADVGGTRVKAAVLHKDILFEELTYVDVIDFDSSQWWNGTFPTIFSKTFSGSLPQRIKKTYSLISFGISGSIKDHAIYLNTTKNIPLHLKDECEAVAKKPVFIENDAALWAKGALYWSELVEEEIYFPCLGITLGTGVGVVLLKSPQELVNVEISFIDCPFIRLHAASEEQPKVIEFGRKSPHKPIGRAFFEWVREHHPTWTKEKIQKVFNQRVIAFITDMHEFISKDLGLQLNAIMVGGGNSRFVSYDDLLKAFRKQILLLNPKNIEEFGVSPDIISLLGALDMSNDVTVEMLPDNEELRASDWSQ